MRAEAEAVTANSALRDATRLVAATYHGERGTRAYDAFEAINQVYFAGDLPWPLITWAITPHGACLGSTSATHVPVIRLHPSILGGTEKESPWAVRPKWLGWRYALDVLLHECIHVSVVCRYGGGTGPTSHNCAEWIAEVTRLAPLLGLPMVAAMSKSKRVRGAEGQSCVQRVCEASVPFKAISRFPGGVREALGRADEYYTGSRNAELHVTGPLTMFDEDQER